MFVARRAVVCAILLFVVAMPIARGDTALYTNSPGSYPLVTGELFNEFGTSSFPPVSETTLSFYQVQGAGPVDVTFRFKGDTGSFFFDFGYYVDSPALHAIDTSTTAGKIAYATQALAPGNATLVFSDPLDNPGAVRTLTVNGGTILGFFLVPDERLAHFQTNQSSFAVNGVGSATLGAPAPWRWPLFSNSGANPGDMDQLMSFRGESIITGNPTDLFTWEDLTRARIAGNPFPSDDSFHDLTFAIEGIQPIVVNPIPEPVTLVIWSLLGALGLVFGWSRRRKA